MALFSERYGYLKPRESLIREQLTDEVLNAICSAFDILDKELNKIDVTERRYHDESYTALELSIWVHFQNLRRNDFYVGGGHLIVAVSYLKSKAIWYKKLDMLEYSIKWMSQQFNDNNRHEVVRMFIDYLNKRFKHLGFAYRIIDNEIAEITSEEEIVEIEQALSVKDSVSNHINTALSLMSQRPDPDYRNSIKESISAVEFICREITGKTTLGDSLKELEKNGVKIPTMLKVAFEKLYVYTNDKSTGIRHALMEETDSPGFDEAKFMLVTCSAFVNYLKAKTIS